jgi:amino acid transporter
MGLIWFLKGLPMQITFSWQALVPDFSSINQLVLFSGILLSLCGLEMSAVHAKEVINPRVEYPKGILLSSILILLFSTLGSVTIASIVPRSEIEFASSSMGAFRHFFETFNMPWATPLIAAVTAFGALGMMSTWIVGPSRGLQATAEHGDLPPLFHKTNQHGMPTNILIAQAIIVTVLTSVFLLMPSVNSSYWILAALASLLYMMMYILMFASAVFLRYKAPDVERSYRVPCGNLGMWIACIFGIIGSSFGVIVSFFPPAQIDTGNLIVFESLLVGSTIVFCLIPFLIFALKKPHWHKK